MLNTAVIREMWIWYTRHISSEHSRTQFFMRNMKVFKKYDTQIFKKVKKIIFIYTLCTDVYEY